MDDLIVLINAKINNDDMVTIDSIMEVNDGIIKTKFTQNDTLFALRHLAEGESELKLSYQLMQKAIALKVLDFKHDGYRLKEFVSVLKQAYVLGIPVHLQS